jgi:hypothetical protein
VCSVVTLVYLYRFSLLKLQTLWGSVLVFALLLPSIYAARKRYHFVYDVNDFTNLQYKLSQDTVRVWPNGGPVCKWLVLIGDSNTRAIRGHVNGLVQNTMGYTAVATRPSVCAYYCATCAHADQDVYFVKNKDRCLVVSGRFVQGDSDLRHVNTSIFHGPRFPVRGRFPFPMDASVLPIQPDLVWVTQVTLRNLHD